MAQTTNVISVKLLVDTKGHRVLFAEARKEFVDFIFSILSLPLGTVIRLLTKEGMVGSLGKLYNSIENLSDTYMHPNQNKDCILIPKAPNVPLLMFPNVESSSSTPKTLYKCPNTSSYKNTSPSEFGASSSFSTFGSSFNTSPFETSSSFNTLPFGTSSPIGTSSSFKTSPFGTSSSFNNCHMYVADDPLARCPQCKTLMSSPASYVAPPARKKESYSVDGGFVKGVVTYMVMDDLAVEPMSTISSITMLNKFNIKDVGALEEKVINFGMDEGVKLLKASLQSKTVLTDVFLGKREVLTP